MWTEDQILMMQLRSICMVCEASAATEETEASAATEESAATLHGATEAELRKTIMMMRRCTRVLQGESAINTMFDRLESSLVAYMHTSYIQHTTI